MPNYDGSNHRKGNTNNYIIDANGCWIWQGSINSNGYGHFQQDYKTYAAHVWHYEQKYEAVPKGKQLDHICRVRPCCNPDHVEPVTCVENIRRGFRPKLNVEKVKEIKTRLKEGEHFHNLARQYKMDESSIRNIRDGKTWKDVNV